MILEQKIRVLENVDCGGTVASVGRNFHSVTLLLEFWKEVKQPLGLVLKQVHSIVHTYSSENQHIP
jgi:hypothetical protein